MTRLLARHQRGGRRRLQSNQERHQTETSRKARPKRNSDGGGGWFGVFVLRVLGLAAVVHYVSLILVFHKYSSSGKSGLENSSHENMDIPDILEWYQSIGMDASPASASASATDTRSQATTSTHKPFLRTLWAIQSKDTEQGLRQRQLLRTTYLNFSQPLYHAITATTATTTTNSEQSMFCSYLEIKSGTANWTDSCQFLYLFVILPHDEDISQHTNVETDVLYFSTINPAQQNWQVLDWLRYSQRAVDALQASPLDYAAWVDPSVLVAPLEMLSVLQEHHHHPQALLKSSTSSTSGGIDTTIPSTHLVITTPEGLMHSHCGGKCSWDREMLLRQGSLIIYSVSHPKDEQGWIPSLLRHPDQCPFGLDVDLPKAIRDCATASMPVVGHSSTVESNSTQPTNHLNLQTIGHQYAQEDSKYFELGWKEHIQLLHDYQMMERKHKVHYISAKFHRDHTKFVADFADLQTALIHWGFHPKQLHLYQGDFPDFIQQDPRWEQHIEFMQDPDLDDLGAGYWFWKPAILEHHLSLLQDGDFIIFSNVEFWNHFPFLKELMRNMESRQANLAVYHNFFPENVWSKREVYELLCSHIPDRFMPQDRSNQYTTNFMVLRKSPGIVDLIQSWTRLVSNYHLLSDEPSVLAEYPEFREHRRDQSILSLLLKCQYEEKGKELFFHPSIKELGWFDAFTFHLDPIPTHP